jgi:release factor glutamine methyltransferase
VKLQQQLKSAAQKLAKFPAGRLEAEILLAHALSSPRSFLYANPELDLPIRHKLAFRKLLNRRCKGEPIAYITGTREFWSLPIKVTPDVLIPRHETELLVEAALERVPQFDKNRIADLGTGSGAIALAIASERPVCEVHATEISSTALALARENSENLSIRLQFSAGSWCDPLDGMFDMIVSNPPYIADNDPHLSQGDCRFEPGNALTPGPDALSDIRLIAQQATGKLNSRGWLLLEHGNEQGAGVREILEQNQFAEIETLPDLSGQERVTAGRL